MINGFTLISLLRYPHLYIFGNRSVASMIGQLSINHRTRMSRSVDVVIVFVNIVDKIVIYNDPAKRFDHSIRSKVLYFFDNIGIF